MLSKQKIYFFFEDTKINLPNRTAIKKSIEQIFKKEGKKLSSVNYIFCSDKKILKINQTFLKHNFYTDIITFNLSEEKDGVQAEIYISIDRVKENSKTLNSPFKTELFRVMVHGALHLCGYNDKKEKEKKSMRQKEDYYISTI